MEEAMRRPLSGEDICSCVGRVPILTYKDLGDVQDVQDLFDASGCCVILYPLQSNTSGHWTCLMQLAQPAQVEFFDSYGSSQGGGTVDSPLKWLKEAKLEGFGIQDAYLRRLLRKGGVRAIYNKAPLQSLDPEIATCGRHVCVRIAKRAVPLAEYTKQIQSEKETPDMIVTKSTYEALGY